MIISASENWAAEIINTKCNYIFGLLCLVCDKVDNLSSQKFPYENLEEEP